ncbi:MAG: ABC transporter ATP-binding protein [Promethearchaeota archaeon]
MEEVQEPLLGTKYVIETVHLVKDFEIGDWVVRAVDDVSLRVKPGEFVVIRGPSGAGKTTLLNLIGGLDKPTSGKIFFSGVEISAMGEESLATFRVANSGFVFQNYNLISTLTAAENILFPMELAGYTSSEKLKRVAELLDRVNLKERDEHLPFQLSAGEQQRVAIARAMANDPPVILADEPTANLDHKSALIISQLFENLKELGKTVLVATHDEKIAGFADRVLEFNDGKIVTPLPGTGGTSTGK